MTEAEWLASRWVTGMRRFLTKTPGLLYKSRVTQNARGRRKLRLFGVAVARRAAHLVTDPELLKLIDAAEAFADGTGEIDDLRAIRAASTDSGESVFVMDNRNADWCRYALSDRTPAEFASQAAAILAERDAASAACLHNTAALAIGKENMAEEAAVHAELFRDIFGNPFRKVEWEKRWNTSAVKQLARTMYESRDFAAMPVLADALQEAGCDNADVLGHCRGDGPHVRGCWVVDLVLGKA
jgi:hypothetical protein